MNIKVPHSWLKDFLETRVSPQKIADCLSLCSASVDKVEQRLNDWIYEIEITTNRVDMMSVVGIAREAAVVLPQFGIKARLKKDPYVSIQDRKNKANFLRGGSDQIGHSSDGGERRLKEKKLKVIIKNKDLCPRFTAVVLENVNIKPSPKIIRERLEKSGIRSLNNVIDISNYLMRAFGQPVHVFDYEKILGKTMILRRSRSSEKITTLDGKTFTLSGNDIVIEDGSRRLIDLAGIMGGTNSAVSEKSQNILLFVQTYNPTYIRQTSMALAQRTEAAQLFEKGLDPELTLPTIIEGIKLAKKLADAKLGSKIIDIYPKSYKPKIVKISLQLIEQRLGTKIQLTKVIKILESLGFKSSHVKGHMSPVKITIPSWRAQDINIPEDIIEEVARIYGYHNLPSVLPPLFQQPVKPKQNFLWEEKIKNLLKNWGLTEVYTYSFVSEGLLEKSGQDSEKHLKVKNSLSSDWEYMRSSLIPNLLEVIAQNKAVKEKIKIFEIANIYNPRKNDLPKEEPHLVIAFSLPPRHPDPPVGGEGFPEEHFCQLKGLIEALLEELSIKFEFKKRTSSEVSASWRTPRTVVSDSKNNWFETQKFLDIFSNNKHLGMFGQLKPKLTCKFEITDFIFIADLNFERITQLASDKKTYHPIPKYPPIIEDLTFEFVKPVLYTKVVSLIKQTSNLIAKIELVDQYKNKKTFRIFYQNPEKSLTDEEVGKVRKEIVRNLEKEGLKLVGQV